MLIIKDLSTSKGLLNASCTKVDKLYETVEHSRAILKLKFSA